MDKLDAVKLIAAFDDEMKRLGEERDHAARNQWFDKAAKLDNLIEGIRKAKFIATSGDFHI